MTLEQKQLQVRALLKRFGTSVPVIGPISMDLEPGMLTVVVGHSGCGKSTLLRCLAGLERPSAGQVSVGGTSVRPDQVGVVFQEPRLMPWLSTIQNVTFGLVSLSRSEQTRRAREMLELVGLSHAEKYLPKELSGGMAQRVALARALAPHPGILLLDEPFSALDPLVRLQMQRHLKQVLTHLDATMLMITHDLDEALTMGDRIIALRGRPGRIAGDWSVRKEDRNPQKPWDSDHIDYRRLRHEILEQIVVD